MARALTAYSSILALTVAYCGPALANNDQVERERAALRERIRTATDSATKRQFLRQLRRLRLEGAANRPRAKSTPARSEPRGGGGMSGSAGKPKRERPVRAQVPTPKPRPPLPTFDQLQDRLERRYQVDLDYDGQAFYDRAFPEAPQALRDKVQAKPWTERELALIEEVMELMKPLMGDGDPIDRVARIDRAVSREQRGGLSILSTNQPIMGHWFPGQRGLTLTDLANLPTEFADPEQQFKSTLIHELAHGLLNHYDPRTGINYGDWKQNPVMKEFRLIGGWNHDGTRRSDDAEPPPTRYAYTNALEDIAETTALYVLDPERLKRISPSRHWWLDSLFANAPTARARARARRRGQTSRN